MESPRIRKRERKLFGNRRMERRVNKMLRLYSEDNQDFQALVARIGFPNKPGDTRPLGLPTFSVAIARQPIVTKQAQEHKTHWATQISPGT